MREHAPSFFPAFAEDRPSLLFYEIRTRFHLPRTNGAEASASGDGASALFRDGDVATGSPLLVALVRPVLEALIDFSSSVGPLRAQAHRLHGGTTVCTFLGT